VQVETRKLWYFLYLDHKAADARVGADKSQHLRLNPSSAIVDLGPLMDSGRTKPVGKDPCSRFTDFIETHPSTSGQRRDATGEIAAPKIAAKIIAELVF
jgi:hypothetical protein